MSDLNATEVSCVWFAETEDGESYGYFDTSCGKVFAFTEPEDTPESCEFKYCCFCGKKLEADHE